NGKIAKIGSPMEITAAGAGLTKISVRTSESNLLDSQVSFPAVNHSKTLNDYKIYFSKDIGPTVSAIISHIESQNDTLIDLRVERPSLEDRFLEITSTGEMR
ncbi:MAG: hypothetical protein V3V66_03715, partial [Anaerolineales bacterium]